MPQYSRKNTNLKSKNLSHKIGLSKRPFSMVCDYRGDGIGTKNKALDFLEDPRFITAWEKTANRIYAVTGTKLPDIRWRAHIALWAASCGLHHEGDFVECGVYTGIYSSVICDYLDFAKQDRSFWLFDTWEGIPTQDLPKGEESLADNYNKTYKNQDIYNTIKQNFAEYPNCHLVRGFLPDSLNDAKLEKISYLSIDLKHALKPYGRKLFLVASLSLMITISQFVRSNVTCGMNLHAKKA
jgi:O-methyltransferase